MAQDMMSTLKGLLGDDAEEKIQSVLSALNSSSGTSSNQKSPSAPSSAPAAAPSDFSKGSMPNIEALGYISKLKSMVDDMSKAHDPRSNLLMSLRPYMRSGRQRSIDNAIRLLNISKISGIFK